MSVFQHQNLQNVQQHLSNPPPHTASPQALRDPQVPMTQPARNPRKRKSPPTQPDPAQPPPAPGQASQPQPTQQQQPPQQQMQHVLPPPHGMMHMPPGAIPYQYDYSPGGLPSPNAAPGQQQGDDGASGSRPLSTSKRAEQNRKAQRAFRERRDQHVKALESRSQLLDAALASADEANRRWEECRALVDQLRVENTALRAALQQATQGQHITVLPPGVVLSSPNSEEQKKDSEQHAEERKD